MLRACILSILAALSAHARAQKVCPWLTQGTAVALMGGEVNTAIHVQSDAGTCEFALIAPAAHSSFATLRMRITVTGIPPKECPSGERLTGIGQDAVYCSADAEGEHYDAIRGRVRAVYFLLTLTRKEADRADKRSWRSSLEQAAEEVAGNLF